MASLLGPPSVVGLLAMLMKRFDRIGHPFPDCDELNSGSAIETLWMDEIHFAPPKKHWFLMIPP